MKNFKFLILFFFASTMCLSSYAYDLTGGGTGWGVSGIAEAGYPIIMNENFQNWTSYTSITDTSVFVTGGTAACSSIWYPDTTNIKVPVYSNSTKTGDSCALRLVSCAVAPSYWSQYHYDPTKTTYSSTLASKGYVEIGRTTSAPIAPSEGALITPVFSYVEGIQYSFSSTGGNKRGFTLWYSTDKGVTWTALRNETGSTGGTGGVNLLASGYGILFEDLVELSNVMFKFTTCSTNVQIVKIHDLIVYGTYATTTAGVSSATSSSLQITTSQNYITTSQEANVNIYTISGSAVSSEKNVTEVSTENLPSGVYIVKATSVSDGSVKTVKIVK